MNKVGNERVIENENLFRAWICLPVAILFSSLAVDSVMTSGPILLQVIFSVFAVYFSANTLSYAAHYTNQRFDGSTEPLFKNKNLSKAVKISPLAIIFVLFATIAVTSSAHVMFQGIFVFMAAILVLSTLAYSAFYTNDYYAQKSNH